MEIPYRSIFIIVSHSSGASFQNSYAGIQVSFFLCFFNKIVLYNKLPSSNEIDNAHGDHEYRKLFEQTGHQVCRGIGLHSKCFDVSFDLVAGVILRIFHAFDWNKSFVLRTN